MKSFKAKLTGAIVLFIILMLVPMIVLAVTNEENIQIISNTDEQGNTEYIVYIQELMQTNKVTFADLKNTIKSVVSKYFTRKTQRSPMIIPVIINKTI